MIETSATDVRASAARKQIVAKDEAAIVVHPHRPSSRTERLEAPPCEASSRSASAALPNRLRQNTMAQRATGASRANRPAVLKAIAERINRRRPLVAGRRRGIAMGAAAELDMAACSFLCIPLESCRRGRQTF